MQRIRARCGGGFTLIEVLVALLVTALAIGGSLGLLVQALRAARSALWHTQATVLAGDLAERIRANAAGAAAYAGAPADPGCDARACAPAERAQQDLHDWRRASQQALPLDQAPESLQVGHLGAGPGADEYRIRMSWRDPATPGARHTIGLLVAPPVRP